MYDHFVLYDLSVPWLSDQMVSSLKTVEFHDAIYDKYIIEEYVSKGL